MMAENLAKSYYLYKLISYLTKQIHIIAKYVKSPIIKKSKILNRNSFGKLIVKKLIIHFINKISLNI